MQWLLMGRQELSLFHAFASSTSTPILGKLAAYLIAIGPRLHTRSLSALSRLGTTPHDGTRKPPIPRPDTHPDTHPP